MVIMASNSSEDGGATSKCFSAIINRLLCAGGLPTHPSDPDHHLPTQLKSTHHHHPANYKVVLPNIESTKPINQVRSSTTPGPSIVARLMGLDPFPDFSSSSSSSLHKRSRTTTLDSILRSRSVNYADPYYVPVPRLDFTKQVRAQAQYEAQDQARHRRVRSSMSFRELPTFLLPQNHELLVLCLDQVDEITKKHEMSLKELMRGKNNNLNKKRSKEEKHKKSCKRKEDDLKPKFKPNKMPPPKPKVHANPSSNLNGPNTPIKPTIKRKEVLVPPRKRNNRCQNSSSNPKPENPAPLDSHPMKVSNSPRSKKYDHPCPNFSIRSKEDDRQEQKQRQLNSSKTNNKPPKCTNGSNHLVDTLKEICQLAEEDAKMGSVWVAGSELDYEDFEEICFEFE